MRRKTNKAFVPFVGNKHERNSPTRETCPSEQHTTSVTGQRIPQDKFRVNQHQSPIARSLCVNHAKRRISQGLKDTKNVPHKSCQALWRSALLIVCLRGMLAFCYITIILGSFVGFEMYSSARFEGENVGSFTVLHRGFSG